MDLRVLGLLHLSIERIQEAPAAELYARLWPCEGLEDVEFIDCH